MLRKRFDNSSFLCKKIRFFLIIVLIIGLFLRYINLDHKIYLYDEVFTSIRISGYTEPEISQQAFDNQLIDSEFLYKFQEPNLEHGVIDTVQGLIKEEPQLPPLYFILTRFWTEHFGGSVLTTRSLSAVFSLLIFPSVYWLCLELFDSSLVAWWALALIAISPVQVLYAQEARMYSLWTALILLSSTALLRAIRNSTKTSWGIYTLILSLGLYTHIFTILTAIAHGMYVVIREKFRLTKITLRYILALTVALLAFSPWIFILIQGITQQQARTSWANNHLSFLLLIRSWFGDLSRVLIDFGVNRDSNYLLIFLTVLTSLAAFFLISLSIYNLYKNTPKTVYIFVILMIAFSPLTLYLRDVILGSQLSTESRYFLPNYIFIQISIAYLICKKFNSSKVWNSITITLVTIGILSCAVSSQSSSWWNKGEGQNKYNAQVANIVNQAAHPLLVSSGSISTDYSFTGVILCLNHFLAPKVKLLLTVEPELPKILSTYSSYDLFLFMPSDTLRHYFEKEFEVKSAMQAGNSWLWQLKSRSLPSSESIEHVKES